MTKDVRKILQRCRPKAAGQVVQVILRRLLSGLDLAISREAPLHFPSGFLSLALAADAGRLVVLPALDFLHDPVAIAFALETPERFFDRFVLAELNAYDRSITFLMLLP